MKSLAQAADVDPRLLRRLRRHVRERALGAGAERWRLEPEVPSIRDQSAELGGAL
jgi:transposase-like protein